MTKAQEILSKLISFPVLGGESNLSIIHWIKEYIEQYGIEAKLVPNQEGTKASLHCRIGSAVEGGVILSGHTDVVPVAGQDWDSDPFTLTDRGDGKLYARGACDMKGFIACCLATLPKMLAADLKRPIYFAFSYDEEVGCLGAPELIADIQKTYDLQPQYAIIGEPSLLEPIVGQKGISVFHTHINGSAGHSSRIKQEVSAVHEAARLVMWLENKMDELIGEGRLDKRFTPPHSSLHVGQIEGGVAFNIIAEQAIVKWDMRTIPKDNVYEILEAFNVYCENRTQQLRSIFPAFKIKTTEQHPPVPPLDTADNQAIVKLVQELTGNQKLNAVSFASEAGQFAQGGYESIICGPGSIEQAHRANEFISKEQLRKGVEMVEALVKYLSEN